MSYYVICRGDTTSGNKKGKYVLLRDRPFYNYELAADYVTGVAPSREPKILMEVHDLPPETDECHVL
jgi:hypothetical protein